MVSREERIANLAATLKGSGLAKSDAQARMMAEEMIGVEEHVQKRYEEEHDKAQEFLRTSKNLGQPRSPGQSAYSQGQKIEQIKPNSQMNQQTNQQTTQSATSRPISNSVPEQKRIQEIHPDINLGTESIAELTKRHEQPHTNQALESMKAEVQQTFEHIQPVSKLETSNPEPVPERVVEERVPIRNVPSQSAIASETISEEKIVEELVQESNAPKLDAQKLVALMEEDGKLEEHTREIKEKPKFIKPKEEYAENNIDLSAMFNVHK